MFNFCSITWFVWMIRTLFVFCVVLVACAIFFLLDKYFNLFDKRFTSRDDLWLKSRDFFLHSNIVQFLSDNFEIRNCILHHGNQRDYRTIFIWLILCGKKRNQSDENPLSSLNLYGSYQRQISPMCGNHVKSLA